MSAAGSQRAVPPGESEDPVQQRPHIYLRRLNPHCRQPFQGAKHTLTQAFYSCIISLSAKSNIQLIFLIFFFF